MTAFYIIVGLTDAADDAPLPVELLEARAWDRQRDDLYHIGMGG